MTWENIPRMVLSAADRFGDAEAVVDGPLRLSFTELAGRIRVAAGAFASAGIGTGTGRRSGHPTPPNGSSRRSAC